MNNVSSFVKENIVLCTCTFGIAIIGYLGYHTVRCINNKCQITEKINRFCQKIIDYLSSSLESKSLDERVRRLELGRIGPEAV